MSKHIDFTNRTFNKLQVSSYAFSKKGERYWNCTCECGNNIVARGSHLKNGSIKSCGCIRINNLTGKIFNRLKVIELAYRKNNRIYWQCNCSCGKTCFVKGEDLTRNKVKSCGCLLKETSAKIGRATRKTYFNDNIFDNVTHDISYIMGFAFGDGSLYRQNNVWTFTISQKFSEESLVLLTQISNILGKTKIYHTKSGMLSISYYNISDTTVKQLNGWGIIERKTMKNHYFDIPEDFKYSWLRGYLDSNGFLTYNKNTKKTALGFCVGNHELANKINFKFDNMGYIYIIKPRCTQSNNMTQPFSVIKICHRIKIQNIIHKIYQDGNLFLNRKKQQCIFAKLL